MVTTVFSDEIVNATELRAKQSHWLTMAARRPVTVTYGSRKLTILNREKIRNLFIQAHYLELFVKHCNEVVKGTKSNAFPWIEHLDDEEKRQFHEEFIDSIMMAIITEDWDGVETLLEDWKATAETESDEEIMKALGAKQEPDKYIALKE
jgi:hypothetical protein